MSNHRNPEIWAENERRRYEGLENLTMSEAIAQFEALYAACKHHMDEAEPFVRPLRMQYLAELQERIGSLNKLR